MARRMIDASMWQNEKVGELPMLARMLLIGMITLADDQGRVKSNPVWLRSQIFPYDDINTEDINVSLTALSSNDTLQIYQSDGKQYVQFVNWWSYQSLQYAMPSKYPKPDGWTDRIRYNFTKGAPLTFNWKLTNGTVAEDTCNENGMPLNKESHSKSAVVPGGNTDAALTKPDDIQVDIQVDVQYKEEEEEEGGSHAHTHENMRNELPPPVSIPATKMSEEQSAIVAVQPMFDPPSKAQVKAAEVARIARPTTKVIPIEDGHPIIIPIEDWAEMVDTLLDGVGLLALVKAGVKNHKVSAGFVLETLCKMDPKFRTVNGVKSVFTSWQENDWRGETMPSLEQYREHASKMVTGRVVCERKDRPKTETKPEPQIVKTQVIPSLIDQRTDFLQAIKPQ